MSADRDWIMREGDLLRLLGEDRSSAQQLAVFEADLTQVVRTIAQRYMTKGASLTCQIVRDIREEALADLGLAARWPGDLLERVATHSDVPPLDGWVAASEIPGLCALARAIVAMFRQGSDQSTSVAANHA